LTRTTAAVMLIGLAIAATCAGAVGQTGGPRDMIQAYRVWKLTGTLDLSDEVMPAFFSRLREIDEKEAELVREEREGVREIQDLLDKEDVRDEDLRRAFQRHEEARAELMNEIRSLRQEALSMLDLRQKCEYVVFEHKFRADLRNMIDRAREAGWRREDFEERLMDRGGADPRGRGVGSGIPGGSGRGRR
jgi:hypothetical protein